MLRPFVSMHYDVGCVMFFWMGSLSKFSVPHSEPEKSAVTTTDKGSGTDTLLEDIAVSG